MLRQTKFNILVLALTCALTGWGQTSKGTIAGTVVDKSGGAVAGASVTVKDMSGAETREVKTGTAGEYRVEAITPSENYSVTVNAPGFNKTLVSNLSVKGSVVTSVNVTLEVGAVSETVSVEAAQVHLQTDSAELSGSISQKEVVDLPISSGNPISLVLLQPGVVSVAGRDGFTNGADFAADGLRPRGNNFLIDGFDNNDSGIGGQALQPTNLEAVREVVTLRNGYSAEFGRGGSSVTNVLYKNGNNEFHGTLWERYQGNALNALPTEQALAGSTENPRSVDNLYGFMASGPAIKNKLFLFGTSQWNHINGSSAGNTLKVPTAAGVATLKSIGQTNANANIIVDSLGGLTAASGNSFINVGSRAGCTAPCQIEVGNAVRTPTSLTRAYEWVLRGDFTPTERDTISARYIGSQNSYTPDLFANASALPTQDTEQGGPARNFGAFWTHVGSPTRVNELRFTAQQIKFAFAPLASTTSNPLYKLPNIAIAELSGVTFGGLTSTFPQGRGHNTYQFQDAFSFNTGSHSFKIGADLTNFAISDTIPFNVRGTLSVAKGGDCTSIGLAQCTSLANFLDGFTGPAGTAGKQFGSQYLNYSQTTQAYYFQDSWRVAPNLSVNYGLRWEYFGAPFNSLQYPTVNLATALTDKVDSRVLQQDSKTNFGPRFGIAYTPKFLPSVFGNGKTVIRAGGGIFYDTFFTNIPNNSAASSPNALGGTTTAPKDGRGLANALGQVSGVTGVLNPKASVTSTVSTLHSPRIYQWNANIERQLPGAFLATIAYVGTRGQDLFLNADVNPGVNGVRLNPNRGAIGLRDNIGDSIYHGLQLGLERSFRNGLMARVNYTFSKAIDNGSEVFANSGGSSYAQDAFNRRGERGPSAFDRPHRATVTLLYQTPFKGGDGAMKAVKYALGNWILSGSVQLQSGAPDTIYMSGYDQNGDLRLYSDRPSLLNPAAKINYSDACLSSSSCISGVGWYQEDGSLIDWMTGAPGTPSQFRYAVLASGNGNVGRNTFRNNWTQTWALSVNRVFPIPHMDRHQIEFKAEAFNPFNHPNPGLVSPDVSDSLFMNEAVTKTGGRVMNLWLKYRF